MAQERALFVRFGCCLTFLIAHQLTHHTIVSAPSCVNVTNVTEYAIGEMIFGDPKYQDARDISWQRPVRNALKPVDVSIRLVVSSLNDVVEKDGVLKLNGYLAIKYYDEFKRWNGTWPYSCIDWITVPFDHVWTPDIAVINAESRYDLLYSKRQDRVRLYSTGQVYYLPGGTFMMYCQFDIRMFPLDESTCVLEIESWRIPLNGQTFTMADPPVSTKYWREHEQWSLVNFSGRVESAIYFTGSSYARATFSLILKRKVEYYLVNVIVPSIIISFAQLSVFSLPVDEVIKIHVCFTCLLAYGVFQLMIIEDMPRASDHIPLLSIYIDLSMGYIAASMIGEAAVFLSLRKSEARNPGKVPRWLFDIAKVLAIPLRIKAPKKPKTNLTQADVEPLLYLHHRYQSVMPFSSEKELPLGARGDVDAKAAWDQMRQAALQHSGTSNGQSNVFVSPWLTSGNSGGINVPTSGLNPNWQAPAFGGSEGASKENPNVAEWQFLARVLDRATFSLYLLSIVATPTVMYGVVPAAVDQAKSRHV